jgi:glycosyltransferase involved in cell wall biosynthesis
MGRVLDQRDGLSLYCIDLLRNMVALDQQTRYVIWLRTAEHKELFSDFPNTPPVRIRAAKDLRDVRFLGYVPNDPMHIAYQAATFFVLAKLCDSFGLPILEAMATGCPAIVSKTCAAPEVAGSAARLIDPYDEEDISQALLEVGGSAERRAQLRRLGLARAQTFTWRDTARRTLAVLDELYPAAAASTV